MQRLALNSSLTPQPSAVGVHKGRFSTSLRPQISQQRQLVLCSATEGDGEHTIVLEAREANADNFAPFGQVCAFRTD